MKPPTKKTLFTIQVLVGTTVVSRGNPTGSQTVNNHRKTAEENELFCFSETQFYPGIFTGLLLPAEWVCLGFKFYWAGQGGAGRILV